MPGFVYRSRSFHLLEFIDGKRSIVGTDTPCRGTGHAFQGLLRTFDGEEGGLLVGVYAGKPLALEADAPGVVAVGLVEADTVTAAVARSGSVSVAVGNRVFDNVGHGSLRLTGSYSQAL